MALQDISVTLCVSVLATASMSVGLVMALLLCMPCFRRKKQGFSNFQNSTTSLDIEQGEINSSFTLTVDDAGSPSRPSAVTIEPLPDIASKLKTFSAPLRPRIGCLGRTSKDASIKLTAAHHPFPRNQIVYLKELGTGWFGKVIESDAEKIMVGVPRSKVVVKMLKDDASREEKLLFFEEVAPYRLMEHTNVMRLLGQCTETTPLLIILEAAAYGNLKQYLCSHRHSEALLIQKNRLMQFAVDLSCGLACLHRHEYLHRDLAARNCLVMSDYTLKIGDYGIADHLYKEDYLTCGADLLPIRWMAPETLKQENGNWTSHNFSKDSDIWAFGVVLWEIATLGEQPYGPLSDEDVLEKVVVNREVQLPEPQLQMPHKDRLYDLMRCCWMGCSQRIQVDKVHGLLQAITHMITAEASSCDANVSEFDQKWAQLMPNQHHWSADSIDDHLASTSRGDANFVSELSQSDSFEDLTAMEFPQENSLHTKAIVHSCAGDGLLIDAQMGVESRIGQTGTSGLNKDASPVFVSSNAADSISATFLTDSSSVPTNDTNSNYVLHNDQTEVFATGIDFPLNGQLLSGSENSSSGFDVLESTADFDLADGKSVSDSIGTCQSSLTGDASMDKDSSSCEFVVINEFKEPTVSPPSSNPSVLNGSPSEKTSEKFVCPDSSHGTASHSDKTSRVIETSRPPQDTDIFTSFGTELSSLSSLVVQAPSVDSDREQPFPSFGTELSSLTSRTVPSYELHSTSNTSENSSVQSSENTASVSTGVNEDSLQTLNDFHFDTLSCLSCTDSQISATGRQELSDRNKDDDPAMTEGFDAIDSVPAEKNFEQIQGTECDAVCSTAKGEQERIQQSSPAGLENGESDHEDSASDNIDVTLSEVRDHIPESTTKPSGVISDVNVSNGFSSTTSLSEEVNDSPRTNLNSDGMLQKVASALTDGSSAVRVDSECVGATGGSTTEGESATDSDSSTNSDSGKDYICHESWQEEGVSSPRPSSPTSSMDSEEYALMIASEIYLSKGLKNSRPFESTFLEPIPEDPIPSISEESVAPVPSESSSVDVKFDEVFEWDDFMGESLVEGDHSPEAGSSPKESFDMSDWMLDMESDSMPSAASSLTSQHSDPFHKESSAASDLRSTAVTTDSTSAHSSASDSESASHSSRSRTHRSYISDLLSNRTKGSSSTNSHSLGGPNKFYSLYEEEFDLESDSQSEGGNSPPVPSFLSDDRFAEKGAGDFSSYAEPHLTQPPSLHSADNSASRTETQDCWDDGQAASSSGVWEESDTLTLD